MATKPQILSLEIILRAYYLRAYKALHLSRVLYKFTPFYSKQTQFAGYSNERKPFYNKGL
jgi:hypothetical protein